MGMADDVAHELRDLLVGQPYGLSHDARGEKTIFGVHDCWGNTFEVSGAINDAQVKVIDAKTLSCHLFYSGAYTRKNYVSPCRHNFDENLSPHGEIELTLALRTLQAPIVTWGAISNLAPVGDMSHDSNIFSVEAVKATVIQRLLT
jgi:hypothetical protein